MKLDPKLFAEQFNRLRACNYFPQDENVKNELKAALRSAPNEIILAAAVNAWMESNTERPTPADLYRVIREQIESADQVRYWKPQDEPQRKCADCHDSGLRGGTRSDPWRFCECVAGRDYERKEPGATQQANETLQKIYAKAGAKIDRIDRMTRDMDISNTRDTVTRDILSRLDGEGPR